VKKKKRGGNTIMGQPLTMMQKEEFVNSRFRPYLSSVCVILLVITDSEQEQIEIGSMVENHREMKQEIVD
jgi:hypothetical protein